jgi:hypothetical protein
VQYVARALVFSAKHHTNSVFSTSLSILPSGSRRYLLSTDVVLSSLLRLLIAIPLHLLGDGLSKRFQVLSRSPAAVSFTLSPRRTYFPRPPLDSCYGLLLPHFRHQKTASVVSTEGTILIGRISDVVRSGRGSNSLAFRSEGVVMAM